MKSLSKGKRKAPKTAMVNRSALAALTKDLLNYTSKLEKSRAKGLPTIVRHAIKAY